VGRGWQWAGGKRVYMCIHWLSVISGGNSKKRQTGEKNENMDYKRKAREKTRMFQKKEVKTEAKETVASQRKVAFTGGTGGGGNNLK